MSSKCRVHDVVGIYALKVFLECLNGCCYASVLLRERELMTICIILPVVLSRLFNDHGANDVSRLLIHRKPTLKCIN